MSKKIKLKAFMKKEKVKLHKEILPINKMIADYKKERKSNWKAFKNKIKNAIGKIESPIDDLKFNINK